MKNVKKLTGIILSVILVFSCCSTAFASYEYDHLPQIYVTGFQSANIYYENDPEKKPLFAPVDTERILGNLKNSNRYISEAIKKKEPNLLYSYLYSFVYDSFGMLEIMPDAVLSIEGVTVEKTVLSLEGDGKYIFYYDSRLSPCDITVSLNDYIDLVLSETDAEKIELVGSSYGSSVVTAYIHEYRNSLDRIDSVVLCVPSVTGIDFFGELLSNELNVTPDAFEDFISGLLDSEVIGDVLKIMNKTGTLDLLLKAMVVPVLRETVYKAVLDFAREVIATIPAIWTTVPEEYFVPAMKTLFGENYTDPDHEYAVTIEKMTYYHNNVKLRAEEILTSAKENYKDMEISVICKYGSPAIPLSKAGDRIDDGLASLETSSFGATCATYNSQLPEDYIQARYREKNFISVNRDIDASTCLFPFNTWIIKGLGHSQKNEDYWKLVNAVAYEDLDVFSDSRYPQFLEVSAENEERLQPLSPVTFEGITTLFQDFIKLVKDYFIGIYNFIMGFFK